MTAISCRVLRNGTHILGGYKGFAQFLLLISRSIRVFDIERPGREICGMNDVCGIVSSIDDDYSSCIAVVL